MTCACSAKTTNSSLAPFFDTMIASRLLGITQFGLNHLVAQYLGVTLDKGSQKADWAQRPLTERMAAYARNDTHYLKPLADRLKTELEAKGRLAWQQESCARLIADCAQSRQPDPDLVWRLKGSHLLGPAGLAVLREIWRWREIEATAANRPPYFILRHESLIELAAAAVGGQPLEPLLPQKFSDRRHQGLTAAIKLGLAVPPSATSPALSATPSAASATPINAAPSTSKNAVTLAPPNSPLTPPSSPAAPPSWTSPKIGTPTKKTS